MGYDRKVAAIQPDSTWEAAITLSSTGDKANCLVLSPITVYRIGILVTTALTVTALVADFDRRITPNSDTGRVDQGVGRLTAPAAAQAIGKVVYKDVAKDLNPGDEIVFAVNTAPTAGAGVPFIEYALRDEAPENLTDLVKSS